MAQLVWEARNQIWSTVNVNLHKSTLLSEIQYLFQEIQKARQGILPDSFLFHNSMNSG
jgi:hypothetical protein